MCFLKLTAGEMMIFDWIVGSCQVNLLKKAGIVRKMVDADPGLKVHLIITFCSIQNLMFFATLVCV